MAEADGSPRARGFGVAIPFVDLLGFDLTFFEGGESEIHFAAQEQHFNSFAVVHGGALMTLLDVSMATAARSFTPEIGVVTIEMKTSFMHPASVEYGPLVARGRLIQRTATLAFSESTVRDGKGRICCHATGTFKYVSRLATGAKSLNVLQGKPQISTD